LKVACDRLLLLTERNPNVRLELDTAGAIAEEESAGAESEGSGIELSREHHNRNAFHLHSPDLWETVLADILARK
jgi:hypothetical protein